MTRLCQYCIILLCCFGVDFLYAADSVQYQHYTIDNGLPSNNVYACMEDRNGFLWITTDKGVVKYNGYSFQVFNTANSGFPDNDIYQIREDAFGRIWIYSLTNDFGYLYNDKYYPVKFPDSLKDGIKRPLYLTSNKNGTFFKLTINNNSYLLTCDSLSRERIFDLGAIAIIEYNDHSLYVAKETEPQALYKIVYNRNHLQKYLLRGNPKECWFKELNSRPRFTMFSDNTVYTYTNSGGDIGLVNLNTGTVTDLSLYFLNRDSKEVIYVWDYPRSNYMITNRFSYVIDRYFNVREKEPITGPWNKETQVSYKTIAGKSIWYSTAREGLWQKTRSLICRSDGNIANKIAAAVFLGNFDSAFYFQEQGKGHLLKLGKNGILKQWDIKKGLKVNSASVTGTQVILSVAGIPVAFNTATGQKTDLFENDKKKIINYDQTYSSDRAGKLEDTSRTTTSRFKDFYFLHQISENLLIGATMIGISEYHISGDSIVAIPIVRDRYASALYLPELKCLVAYNLNKILVYNPFTRKKILLKIGAGIFRKIRCIKKDELGNVYVQTDQALIMFDPATLRYKVLQAGFMMNDVCFEFNHNTLFLAGRFGSAAARIKGIMDIGPFYTAPNVKGALYRQVDGLLTVGKDSVLLKTDRGLFYLNMDRLFLQQNSDYFSFSIVKPYNKAVHSRDTIVIRQPQSLLGIDAINFYGEGSVHYNYMINISQAGDNWQQTATGELSIADLQPGVYYHLKIKASDDIWKSGVTDVLLYIPPYWYQTHNARIFFLISGSLILILAVIGIVSLARQAVIRAQAKRRMLTELELRAVYSQINPHFIFNTLSTALYFIDRKDFDNAYKHVNKFSHLLRSYLKSSHDRYVLLSEEIDMLKRYIELQQTRFESLFVYEIRVENRVPADHIQIPSLLLQPLVENAINHGLFHRKETGGRLYISFQQGNTSDELICMIEDNGIGRMRAMDLKKMNDAERTSYGSKLTDKLVDIFRQYEAMNIHIEYIDKSEPETGTIVRLTIGNVKYVV